MKQGIDMSHHHHHHPGINSSSSGNIPVSEVYWTLVAKADKKFSKIRDLPYYHRNRYDTYFSKVFKVYTQLWKFQQENRQKLVEAGLKRWEIGDIASRIGQLYFGQYMRTSEASYLSESYIFYEAVLTREYFKDGMFQDVNLACKQLRLISRFLTVCLVLNRREMVYQLVNQLKMLLDECKRAFQETDFKEWKVVIQEIVKFLKADTAFMNIRPLRYSVAVDLHIDCLPHVVEAKRKLRLRDAILCSYHPNEVKFSELTLDTFRMLQCLEWEPSGSFYQTSGAPSSGAGSSTGQNGTPGPSCVNYSQDIIDPTLPPNPRKAILYRPTLTSFIAVLATTCEELPPDGVLLIYLSASGSCQNYVSSLSHSGASLGIPENIFRGFQSQFNDSESASTSPLNPEYDNSNPASAKEDPLSRHSGGLHIGSRGGGGLNDVFPCDLLPFTRKPLFLVIDSNISGDFKALNGAEKGESVAMLLSPTTSFPLPAMDTSRQPNQSSFTIFLAAPLQAFTLMLGFTGSDVEMDLFNKAEKLLSSSLNQWGQLLATSDNLNAVWAQILSDPFLRRLLLRFIFCRAVLALYASSFNKTEYLPECIPPLPDSVNPTSPTCQSTIRQLAEIFGAANKFSFSEDIILPENRNTED
ncbi:PREDICTED: protein SCAI [Ipomoea nil]|uniref:protein SCAI n=1 Tax=Ipomoea nil TaxID=35883 RepID=UPI000900ED05|nr:PREDICTED: protein SCAI [Ipomoea nil]